MKIQKRKASVLCTGYVPRLNFYVPNAFRGEPREGGLWQGKKPLTVKEVNALPGGRYAVGSVKGLTVEKRDGKITGHRLTYSKGGSEKVTTYLGTYTLPEVCKKAAADLALYESGPSPLESKSQDKDEKRAENERMTFYTAPRNTHPNGQQKHE